MARLWAMAVREPAEAGEAIMPGALAGVSVVVVDDDPDTLELLRSTLKMAGASVEAAASADEALALCRGRQVDAVVSDIGMPGRDGYSLIEEIRGFPSGLQPAVALALSAYASPRDIQRSLDAGFREHVAKPVDPGVLVHTLRDLLAVENASRERSDHGGQL